MCAQGIGRGGIICSDLCYVVAQPTGSAAIGTMTRQLSTLLLLVAFGLGFLMGPHPCGATHAERESAPASCHETQPSPTGAQEEDGNGCGAFCQHACHMAAI